MFASLNHSLPEPAQRLVKRGVIRVTCHRPGHQHNIHGRKIYLIVPERLPGDPLDPVSVHGARRDSPTDGKAETGKTLRIRGHQHGEMPVGDPVCPCEDPLKCPCRQ